MKTWMKTNLANMRYQYLRQKKFFTNYAEEITKTNVKMLLMVSLGTILLVLSAIAFTPVFIKDWRITPFHMILPILLALLYCFIIWGNNKRILRPDLVDALCVLQYIMIMASVIAIDVFTEPTTPESFMAVFLAVAPMLYTLRIRYIVPLQIISEVVFIISVYRVKTSNMLISHDIYTSFTGLIMSMILLFVIMRLRISDMELQMRYKHLSTIDALTGVLNKATVEQYISDYLDVRSKGKGCALIIIDIDHFKKVNDAYGHTTGDEVIETIGDTLLRSFRSGDVIGRFGGDEFIVFLKSMSDEHFAVRKADEVRKTIKERLFATYGHTITCSAGIAVSPKLRDVSFQELFDCADSALYEAKESGRNHSVMHVL